MNKPVFMTALLFSAIGFGAGIGVHQIYTQPVRELLEALPLSVQTSESTQCVSTLRLLRAGNTDGAIAILETRLDGALIGLGSLYPNASEKARLEAHTDGALRVAREYRRTYPHESDVRYAGAVAAALAIPTNSD
ncbi:MAG TPA: hypothetical protein VK961_02835 [Chthoniobacter sp.]|nr:hypothetical protein [Chthoniobacter sp.]